MNAIKKLVSFAKSLAKDIRGDFTEASFSITKGILVLGAVGGGTGYLISQNHVGNNTAITAQTPSDAIVKKVNGAAATSDLGTSPLSR